MEMIFSEDVYIDIMILGRLWSNQTSFTTSIYLHATLGRYILLTLLGLLVYYWFVAMTTVAITTLSLSGFCAS